jgi:hypothetical protein
MQLFVRGGGLPVNYKNPWIILINTCVVTWKQICCVSVHPLPFCDKFQIGDRPRFAPFMNVSRCCHCSAQIDVLSCAASCRYRTEASLLSNEVSTVNVPANIWRSLINTLHSEVICIVYMRIKVVNTNFFFCETFVSQSLFACARRNANLHCRPEFVNGLRLQTLHLLRRIRHVSGDSTSFSL